jgi:hypothetical protein
VEVQSESGTKADAPGKADAKAAKGNGPNGSAAKAPAKSKPKPRDTAVERPDLAIIRKALSEQFNVLLRRHLKSVAESLESGGQSASISCKVYWRTRKDLDLDLPLQGQVTIPVKLKTFKARMEPGDDGPPVGPQQMILL